MGQTPRPTTGGAVEASGGPVGLVGCAASLQVSIWMRLSTLLPLLPIIYADRESDLKKNLRSQLATAMLQLLTTPHVRPLTPLLAQHSMQPQHKLQGAAGAAVAPGPVAIAVGAAAVAADVAGLLLQGHVLGPGGLPLGLPLRHWHMPPQHAMSGSSGGGAGMGYSQRASLAAAAAAAEVAGESLFERLLSVLHALLAGRFICTIP